MRHYNHHQPVAFYGRSHYQAATAPNPAIRSRATRLINTYSSPTTREWLLACAYDAVEAHSGPLLDAAEIDHLGERVTPHKLPLPERRAIWHEVLGRLA